MGRFLEIKSQIVQDSESTKIIFSSADIETEYDGDEEILITNTGTDWSIDHSRYDTLHQQYTVVHGRSLSLFKNEPPSDFWKADVLEILNHIDELGNVQHIQIDVDNGEHRLAITLDPDAVLTPHILDPLSAGVKDFFDDLALTPSQAAPISVLQNDNPEAQIEHILAQLKKNPKQDSIIFNNKLYRLGQDSHEIHTDINTALREAKSIYRVFDDSNEKRIAFAYGEITSERSVEVHGQPLWEMTWDSIKDAINLTPNLALTDTRTLIVILKKNIQHSYEEAIKSPRVESRADSWIYSRADLFLKLQQSAATAIREDLNISVMTSVPGFLAHEHYHTVFRNRYDSAVTRWANQSNQPASPYFKLYVLMEMRSDLEQVDYIIKLNQSGKAKEAMNAFSGLLLFRKRHDLLLALLLPSASISETGNMTIDWQRLSKDRHALANLLDDSFASLSNKFYISALGLMTKREPGCSGKKTSYISEHEEDAKGLRLEYETILKKSMFQKVYAKHPNTSPDYARVLVDESIVSALAKKAPIDIKQETQDIWNWARSNLEK